MPLSYYIYCYANRNDLISFIIKNNKKNYSNNYTSLLYKYTSNYTGKCSELVTSKPPTTPARSNVNKIHPNKYIKYDGSKPSKQEEKLKRKI